MSHNDTYMHFTQKRSRLYTGWCHHTLLRARASMLSQSWLPAMDRYVGCSLWRRSGVVLQACMQG